MRVKVQTIHSTYPRAHESLVESYGVQVIPRSIVNVYALVAGATKKKKKTLSFIIQKNFHHKNFNRLTMRKHQHFRALQMLLFPALSERS